MTLCDDVVGRAPWAGPGCEINQRWRHADHGGELCGGGLAEAGNSCSCISEIKYYQENEELS